ncbi:carbohydrate ABC transporter permease [Actinopolymorpha alba]|uniref:carbohydrate ABC transporter permease n=1 Tax=Actinopolymorpha alba TaxID=533267 RepID=UPI00036B7097|nr:carbohydrate ABC transporter permease [Actinopolymorpha alba]
MGTTTKIRRRPEAFNIVNGAILLLIAVACIYPFIYIASVSVSDGPYVASSQVYLLPKGLNFETYRYIFTNPRLGIVQGVLNSVFYTVVGTFVAVILTYCTAYVLSRKKFRGRHFIMMAFLASWIFEAGIIPNYIINDRLGLVNSRWVMILPGAISTFLLIVTRAYLESIPDELEESASIDGANDFQIMWKIYLPLAVPVLATTGIFYAVTIWNSFLIPLIYLQDKSLQPIQLVLYNLLINQDPHSTSLENLTLHGHQILPQNIQAATMILAIVPILFFYPFAQRYFTKGITIGALKG